MQYPEYMTAEDIAEFREEWDRVSEEWDRRIGANDSTDDAEALASIGWGTDEDYGYFDDQDL